MFVKHLNLKQTKKTKLWSSSKLDILLDRLKSYFLIFFYMQEYIVSKLKFKEFKLRIKSRVQQSYNCKQKSYN